MGQARFCGETHAEPAQRHFRSPRYGSVRRGEKKIITINKNKYEITNPARALYCSPQDLREREGRLKEPGTWRDVSLPPAQGQWMVWAALICQTI